jgi:hypothetical protein
MDLILAAITINEHNAIYINNIKQEIQLNKSAKEELHQQYLINNQVILGLNIINGMINDDKTAIINGTYDNYIKY